MFSPVIVPTPPGDRPLAMLYLEGLPNTVDIVCYKGEKILRVLDEWLTSCGVSLPHTHWGDMHRHIHITYCTTQALALIHSYCGCHGRSGTSFRAFLCRCSLGSSFTTPVTPDAVFFRTTRSAILRALSPYIVRLASEQHVHLPSQDCNNVHIWN